MAKKRLVINGFKDVTWREYREYSKVLREIAPGEEDQLNLDELNSKFLVAAIRIGIVDGVPQNPEFKEEDLDDYMAHDVIIASEKAADNYTSLRTPDPN